MKTDGLRWSGRRFLVRIYPWIIALILLGLALRVAPIEDVFNTLSQLTLGQLLLIALVNTGIALLFAARWWIVLRALETPVRYLSLSAYRLSAFAVSYFTPGPQFGGEPLQVFLIRDRDEVPDGPAAASVTLDKAIELLANFTFLAFGAVLLIRFGLFPNWPGVLLRLIAFGLLLAPILFLIAAWRGKRPGTWLIGFIPQSLSVRIRGFERSTRFIATLEDEVIAFCQGHLKALLGAVLVSMLTWVVLVIEYWMMLWFLGVQLDVFQTIAVITIARFAFLTPLPGGLGALEAGQMFALTSMGYSSAVGLSLALLIRARDLVFGSLGLLLGSAMVGRKPPRSGDPEPRI